MDRYLDWSVYKRTSFLNPTFWSLLMRALIVLPMFAALALAGCGAEGKPEGKSNPDTGKVDGTLVKLKVPGME